MPTLARFRWIAIYYRPIAVLRMAAALGRIDLGHKRIGETFPLNYVIGLSLVFNKD
jgi:hypothetical protein